jgi:hypothetical protein
VGTLSSQLRLPVDRELVPQMRLCAVLKGRLLGDSAPQLTLHLHTPCVSTESFGSGSQINGGGARRTDSPGSVVVDPQSQDGKLLPHHLQLLEPYDR